MAEQELVIEEAQREDAASLARLLETVALVSDVCPKISENKSINMCLSNENVSKRTPKK